MSTQWTVFAYNMADRSDQFRNDFLTNYWIRNPRPAYPLVQQLTDSTIRPSNSDAWDLITNKKRESAPFEGDSLVSRGPSALAPFTVLAAGQTLHVDITIPSELDIPVNVTGDTITFTVNLSMFLHEPPVDEHGAALPIGNNQQLNTIMVGKASIEYALLDVDSGGQWSIVLQLRPQSRLSKAVAFLAAATTDDLCACLTDGGGGAPTGGGACTLCSCPEWRSDFGDPPKCINIRPPDQNVLCGHTLDAHPGAQGRLSPANPPRE